MNIFILGGTGLIGRAVATVLAVDGHQVTGLARTTQAIKTLRNNNINPLAGDLRIPTEWLDTAQSYDAFIQCAATWDDNMADVDLAITHRIIESSKHRTTPLRVLYTGGCWLFGKTGDNIAVDTDHRPGFKPFDWMLRSADLLMSAPCISAAIIHPAMVYDGVQGAMARYHTSAANGEAIEIWGDANTRWPLIHANDLGRAYSHIAPRLDLTGHINASTEIGIPAHQIAGKIAKVSGSANPHVVRPARSVIQQFGPAAAGPMLDQQMASPRLRAIGWKPHHTFM